MPELSRFSPEVIELSASALGAAVIRLTAASPRYVNILAQHIIRLARAGERDVAVLTTSALVELREAVGAG